MGMSKRMFRTKQAVEAFQLCLECSSLPDNKRDEVENELKAAKIRLQHQDDAVSCLLQPAQLNLHVSCITLILVVLQQ